MNAAAIFDRAHGSFRAGDLQAARADLLTLLTVAPNNVAVLHLLGLTEKGLGNQIAAKTRFEQALRLTPDDAELQANAANLFAAMGDGGLALPAYARAIALAPSRLEFRLNRAIALLDMNMVEAAVEDIDHLMAHEPLDARFLTVAGQVYRAANNHEAAISAFRRAVEIEPSRPIALAGLGELLLECGHSDAVAVLQKAYQVLPNEAGLAMSFAEALESVGRYKEAIALLDQVTIAKPEWTTGHLGLARMRGEAGDDQNGGVGFERALVSQSQNIGLWASYASFLRSVGSPAAALIVLERAKIAIGFEPLLALLEAGIADDLGDTDRSAELLRLVPQDYQGATSVQMRHFIRIGQPDAASRFAESALASSPDDISIWALASLCWRLLGDRREGWLNPPGLFSAMDIGLPGDPDELADALRQLHVARHHPAGQSLRHGTQTRGSLFRRSDPLIAALREHIRSAVSTFVSELPPKDPKHPLLRHRDQMLDFSGSWSVRLTQGGYHVSHIHPAGILSSAFYVALPDHLDKMSKEGWLEIGGAPQELETGLAPLAEIEPKPGRLVLFPSYLFHGTRPFASGERLSVAFDMVASTRP